MNKHAVTLEELSHAQDVYKANEYRELVYRAALPLVDLALRKQIKLTVAEALAVLLQSWNKAYYQYRKFSNEHLLEIENLLKRHGTALGHFRERSIEGLTSDDETEIMTVFQDFERVLGPVGAAKSLHLLAQRFFPLWDNSIAQHYELRLSRGRNADRYCRFMAITSEQVRTLGGEQQVGSNPLKALDEYNYCNAKGWLTTGKIPPV
jgi:hypothetical protein